MAVTTTRTLRERNLDTLLSKLSRHRCGGADVGPALARLRRRGSGGARTAEAPR
jgi:hypothetical protein